MIVDFKSLRIYLAAVVFFSMFSPFVIMHAAQEPEKGSDSVTEPLSPAQRFRKNLTPLLPIAVALENKLILQKATLNELEQQKVKLEWLRTKFKQDFFSVSNAPTKHFWVTLLSFIIGYVSHKGHLFTSSLESNEQLQGMVPLAMIIVSLGIYFNFLRAHSVPYKSLLVSSCCGMAPLGLIAYTVGNNYFSGLAAELIGLLDDSEFNDLVRNFPPTLKSKFEEAYTMYMHSYNLNELTNELAPLARQIPKIIEQELAEVMYQLSLAGAR